MSSSNRASEPLCLELPPKFAKIIVGHQAVEYIIPRDLLIHSAPYFRAALESNFLESETQTIKLTDIEPNVFGKFHHWLYTKELIFGTGANAWQPADSHLLLLSQLWNFGDRIFAVDFQNYVMKLIYYMLLGENDETHLREMLHHAYETDKGSMVKNILVHKICGLEVWEMAVWLRQGDLPVEFTTHIAFEMKRLQEGRKTLESGKSLGKCFFEPVKYYLVEHVR